VAGHLHESFIQQSSGGSSMMLASRLHAAWVTSTVS
jgi:hypothetical protein